jgi:uncharacterized membrane protein
VAGGWTDRQVEQTIGTLLRAGVLLSAAVVTAGGVAFLARHGGDRSDHRTFHGEPAELRGPVGVASDALAGDSRGLIQLGLLLLIATPVARVAFSVYAFARQRDRTYVAICLVVLAVLLYSLLGGAG